MTHDLILAQVNTALMTVLIVVAPILLVSVVAGVIVGLLQALTQIQDQTLPQAVKLLLVLVMIAVLGPVFGKQVSSHALAWWGSWSEWCSVCRSGPRNSPAMWSIPRAMQPDSFRTLPRSAPPSPERS
jgi:type III secretion protein S